MSIVSFVIFITRIQIVITICSTLIFLHADNEVVTKNVATSEEKNTKNVATSERPT